MAKKSANATTAAQKLKKGAKKLLGTAKKSGKLAAALPFAALMVEEVRAAQIETMPSFDLAGLDPFAQPEQPQELVLEEVAPEGLTKAADEEVQGLLVELGDESRTGDLLLAQAETVNERAAGYIASDAGSSAAASSATAAGTAEAAAAGFELSGLPAVAATAGPAGVLVAAAATVAVAANNNNGGAAPEARNDVDNGDGTHLSTSLSDLQSGGVDAVNATGDVLHLNVGNVSSLSPTTAFPLFGDANKDGILSADENAALDVYLDVTSAQQLADLNQVLGVSGLRNLAAAGVDHVQINVANDTALKAMLADSQFGTRMETLNANGMTGNVVNLAANQSATLSLQDVDAMIAHGMHFAADDQVTLHATSAEATHLTSSLKDLQAMGVDAVTTGAGVDNVHINLGGSDAAGTATNAAVVFNSAGLPTFASEDNVTLDVANVGQLHSIAASGAALHAANIDHVQLNLNDQAAFAASFSSNSIFQVADTVALKNAQVDECFLLNSDHLCLEKDSLCLGSWSYEQAIQHRDVFNDGYISVRNLYHQLSSLHKVTGMMNEFDPDYVVFLRPDLLYHDPMLEVVKSFIEDRKYNILTPSWHRWSGENDRLAIADRIGAKVYGERVKYAGQFIEKFKYIHSEQLLKFVIDQSRVSHGHFDTRASRVRLGGVVKPEDFSL